MVHEWPVNCPRFMDVLRMVGLDCVSQMRYLRMNHHLLTALVERWSPQINSFHLIVDEMTITLQDVAMILGVHIDGPALVGHPVVGAGRRWLSWPDCCDDLLGSHPLADVVYRDPFDHRITLRFHMGQAHSQTCVPLRWLRWTFWRDSYLDLNDMDFWRHVRAYILFILGCHLLPDTSGSEIHLQYLTIMEDLAVFSTYSLGGAVLAHLYRELGEATRPSRANIAGCIHLLQIWAWEHLHVGRPLLRVPFPVELGGLSVGFRWNEDRLRELPVGNLITYRDELDGLLDSQVIWQPYTPDIQAQVAQICLSGADIWTARVPLISWKRVEWHLLRELSIGNIISYRDELDGLLDSQISS
ncbi:serine/threonine-protein phosphatase 7 long form homolog [Dendrobium catenatum]|uniref:serine/threonine-protein phosphatase 7 long form homolog n=1 Tax=Dendrobium catenatum TaxID=906689 RepID=UPI00109FFEEF|nr:serine/threonine-protein phosphatase 7 long form homolog [Dendrobium catenatum]